MTGQHFRARVTVQLNAGVNDPQGLTVRGSLHDLGFAEVREVRIGKLINIELAAASEAAAAERAEAMCRQLLVNPVIESFAIEALEPVADEVAQPA
ncbi:MAG: phosphoribosylformylglycinamidine synthase subunit PurS [Chloroflexota bacterium]|nr:phosphoribosylformylglycinamidine synthase subunit PurS [Chloroflexota bacterium]